MLQVYIILVREGRKCIDDVPAKYREAVAQALGIGNKGDD